MTTQHAPCFYLRIIDVHGGVRIRMYKLLVTLFVRRMKQIIGHIVGLKIMTDLFRTFSVIVSSYYTSDVNERNDKRKENNVF